MTCGTGNCNTGCNTGCGTSSSHYYCNTQRNPNFPPAYQVRTPTCDTNNYGAYQAAPCGLANPGACGTCCWDSTLCYPVKQPCKPGDRHVTIQMPNVSPNLTGDVGATLAVYNYSVQNVLSRTLKFITSYYDWVYCQNVQIIGKSQTGTGCNEACPCLYALPPASVFTQFAQVVSYGITVVEQSNLSDCLCANLCGILQILVGLDSNKSIRDFILNNAFEGNSYDKFRTAGCGNLYNEEYFSTTYGGAITSFIELVAEVAKSLEAFDDPDRAETILQKICRCLISAAAGDDACCCDGPKPGFPEYGGVKSACGPSDTCPATPASAVYSPGYNWRYRAQFYAMLVDWMQFILFDRDCRKFPEDKCECCPAPPTVEQWLEKRCKVGTGDGQCVVCTGACKKYRRADDFKPMLSSLLAIRHTVTLWTLPRDGNYQGAVAGVYSSILSDFSQLYGNGEVTFYPDCAAPQFCCSSELNCGPQAVNGCKNVCDATPVAPYPIPDIDRRPMFLECDDGTNCDTNSGPTHSGCYTPHVCGLVTGHCGDDTVPQTICDVANPCVRMPNLFPLVDCSDSCCDADCCW